MDELIKANAQQKSPELRFDTSELKFFRNSQGHEFVAIGFTENPGLKFLEELSSHIRSELIQMDLPWSDIQESDFENEQFTIHISILR